MVTPKPEPPADHSRPAKPRPSKAAQHDEPRQLLTFRRYLHLQSQADRRFAGSLAGHLVVCTGLGLRGKELAIASTIAGATFLGIEADPRPLKTAVRNGSCNFMVNTLDEALRILKNELRKRQPVSVGLLGFAGELLSAMVERGVQPDLLCDATPLRDLERYKLPPPRNAGESAPQHSAQTIHWHALLRLTERGAVTIDPTNPEPPAGMLEVTWTASTPQDLQRLDRLAMEILADDDLLRRRWLQGAAAAFHRQKPLERVVGLLPQQLQPLLDALTRSKQSMAFTTPASLRWLTPDGSMEQVAW